MFEKVPHEYKEKNPFSVKNEFIIIKHINLNEVALTRCILLEPFRHFHYF